MRVGSRVRWTIGVLLIGVSTATCGGDDPETSTPATTPDAGTATEVTTTEVTTTEVTTTEATTETEPDLETDTTDATPGSDPAREVGIDDVAFTDPAVTGPADAVCTAYDRLATDGAGALTGVLTPDAVVVDAVSGDEVVGADNIAGHADELIADGLESAGCIHLVQSDRWVAETIMFHYDDFDVRPGIMAVHVTEDGLVDRLVHHASDRTDVPGERVDPETGTSAIGAMVCEAWAENEVDELLTLMTPEPAVHTQREFVGPDAVRAFAEMLPYDIHTCGVPIQYGEWEAIESIMTDPDAGAERSMLAVLRLEGEPSGSVLVSDIWFHFDA